MADEKEKKEENCAPEEDKSIENILRDREKLDAQLATFSKG